MQSGFEINFLTEWDRQDGGDLTASEFAPLILAGPNGSGKSNVLEVLAPIFYHIECQHLTYRPDLFAYNEETNPDGFNENQATPNAFELEYLIPTPDNLQEGGADITAHIKIVKMRDSGAQLFCAKSSWRRESAIPPTSLGVAAGLCLGLFVRRE